MVPHPLCGLFAEKSILAKALSRSVFPVDYRGV